MASRMHTANRTSAWFQGVAIVAAIGVVAVLLSFAAQRPFDQDTLAILTGQLRSDAHESRELARLTAEQATYATFTQQHARELDEHVADLAKSLSRKPAAAALEPVRRDAEQLAREIDTVLSAIAADAAAASAQAAALDRLSARADGVNRRTKPGA